MSTAAGGRGWRSTDIVQPILVPVDLASHGAEIGLLDAPGHRAGTSVAHEPVVDRGDRDHLGRRAGEERLLGGVQIASVQGAHTHLVTEVAGDGDYRGLGD